MEKLSVFGIIHKFRKPIVVSLVIWSLFVPVVDGIIVQRDRNRNMLYGELFWSRGFGVYDLTDEDLNNTIPNVPEDHLLTDVLNVTYEYPIITLMFFAGIALIEPGVYGPHYLANWILILVSHMSMVFFVYLSQDYWNKKWYRQIFGAYYCFGLFLTVGFAKIEPFVDLLFLISIYFLREKKYVQANILLGLAFQTKLYPAYAYPFFFLSNPTASIAFLLTAGSLTLPLIFAGVSNESLVAHLLNSSSYSDIITNPFYIGWIFENPLSILAPLTLFIAFLYCVLETKRWRGIPIIQPKFRIQEPMAVLLYLIPLGLVFLSWVLIWYYAWFITAILLFEREVNAEKYRYILIGFVAAHIVGVIVNPGYFLTGPLEELLSHFK
ncbi:MAG: conserved membrane protein of unknown function [Candidatus Thorarchaeota archaeon]|nr:MAG: conserved membrane protein of unknown function [Candidatus Thorarchaeota archaeon]